MAAMITAGGGTIHAMTVIDWAGLGFFLFVFFIIWPLSAWVQIRNWERRHPGRSWWAE